MDPSINSIVNARRRFASVMHLYPCSGESQPTMPIDRFDRIVCTTYETIVDVHRFPVEQIQICIDKEAGKLIVCGYREGDVPQFGFKSDFFKELDIPLGVDMESITATYEDCGYVHFSLPCSQKKKIKGREMAITPVGLRSTAGLTLSSRKTDRNCCTVPVPYSSKGSADTSVKVHKSDSVDSKCASPHTLYSAKSTGNLSSFDSNRTIWDKPYISSSIEKQEVAAPAPVKHQLFNTPSPSCKQTEQINGNTAKYSLEQRSTAPVKTSEVNLRKLGKPNVSECVKSIQLKSCESFTQSDYSLDGVKIVKSSESKKGEPFSSIKKHTDRLAANLDSFKREIKEANERIEQLYKIAEKSANESTANKRENLFQHGDRNPKYFGKFKERLVPVQVTNEYFYQTEDIKPTYKFIENKAVDVSKTSSTKHSNERIIPIEIESSEKPTKNVKYNSTVYIEEENYETEI